MIAGFVDAYGVITYGVYLSFMTLSPMAAFERKA